MQSRYIFLLAWLAGTICGCTHRLKTATPMERSRFYQPLPADDPLRGDMVPVHDPSIVRAADGTYIVFGTDLDFLHSRQFLQERCSRDLIAWKGCGHIFKQIPAWVLGNFPGLPGLWAPDISHYHGLYHLYYAASTLGSQHSAIGLATNQTLDPSDPNYSWNDHGAVLTSKFGDDFNAIDPNVVVEHAERGREPRVWLNYGSFWKGLFQQELDPATGKLLTGAKRYHLAQQPADRHGSIEASAMIEHDGWYYLFASVGICCDIPIERDTYEEIVGRSRSLHGPFIAEDGTAMLKGGGTILIAGDTNWIGPGGGSLWTSADGSNTLLTFHALHRRENGALDLWIENVTWKDNWPVLRPLT